MSNLRKNLNENVKKSSQNILDIIQELNREEEPDDLEEKQEAEPDEQEPLNDLGERKP